LMRIEGDSVHHIVTIDDWSCLVKQVFGLCWVRLRRVLCALCFVLCALCFVLCALCFVAAAPLFFVLCGRWAACAGLFLIQSTKHKEQGTCRRQTRHAPKEHQAPSTKNKARSEGTLLKH
jgi:hypothetical protein